MRALRAFMRAITWVNETIGKWMANLVLIMFVLLLMEVGFRYVLRSPTVWTNELTQMLFGAYAVLSGGYLMARNGHVNVDLLYSRLPYRVKAAADLFTSLLFFLFVGVLLWYGSSLAHDSVMRLEHTQSAWNPPVWPIKLMIPLGALLLLLQGIVKFIEDILIVFNIDGAGTPPPEATSEKPSAGDQL